MMKLRAVPNDPQQAAARATAGPGASWLRLSWFGFRHVFLVFTCAAFAQNAAPPATPPDEEDVPELEPVWDFSKGRGRDLTVLDKLVPPGQSHSQLRYSLYRQPAGGGAHELRSQFESRLVTRVDAAHLEFRDAVVSLFGDSRYPGVATRMITTGQARYDLVNDLFYTRAPVQIMDREVTVRGRTLLQDTVTGISVFDNGLELYYSPAPPPDTAAPAPVPAPAPGSNPAPSPAPAPAPAPGKAAPSPK